MTLTMIRNETQQANGAELKAWAEQEVAAYREKQIEQGILRELGRAAKAGCWVGRIQGALFVATAVFLWWVGGKL